MIIYIRLFLEIQINLALSVYTIPVMRTNFLRFSSNNPTVDDIILLNSHPSLNPLMDILAILSTAQTST